MVDQQPLVSVFTPVYNTEQYIRECIESIINQTYGNWEYLIVNNQSTDNTLDIINEYARKDPRIRVLTNDHFLGQIKNWNNGLKNISPQSKYCKILHADDWLYPECIEKMVALAEKNPIVGIVGSYRIDENKVNLDGLDPGTSVFSGREICKMYLLGQMYVFGSPSNLMFRSEIIRKINPFYDETNIHADTDVCLKILEKWDFGFIHQVLSYTRRHNESSSSLVNKYDTRRIERISTLHKYGKVYLNQDELEKRRKQLSTRYYRFLAKKAFEFKELPYWKYHIKELKSINVSINWFKVILCVLYQLTVPVETYPHLRKGLKRLLSGDKNSIQKGELSKVYSGKSL